MKIKNRRAFRAWREKMHPSQAFAIVNETYVPPIEFLNGKLFDVLEIRKRTFVREAGPLSEACRFVYTHRTRRGWGLFFCVDPGFRQDKKWQEVYSAFYWFARGWAEASFHNSNKAKIK